MSKTDYVVPFKWHKFEIRRTARRFPDNSEQQVTFLHHPGAVVIIPLFENNDLLCVRQYRASIDQWIIEFPAGTLEPREQPHSCAQRELIEECDYKAQQWTTLGELLPAPGFCDERQYLFLAQDLSPEPGICDDDEFIETLRLSLNQFEERILCGDVLDAKTIASFYKLRLHLKNQLED